MNKDYKILVDSVIESLKSDLPVWRKVNIDISSSVNYKGTDYKGVNSLSLYLAMRLNNYTNNVWMTYKQALTLNAKVKKGSKGHRIFYFDFINVEDKNKKDEIKEIFFMKTFVVFNISQIENINEDEYVFNNIYFSINFSDLSKDSYLEKFVGSVNAKVLNKNIKSPCFSSNSDCIVMPTINTFKSKESYYSTLLHELVHWTGHESRLNRKSLIDYHKHDKTRAFEELVAELGSVFLSSKLGIETEIDKNHLAYIDSWHKLLNKDNRALMRACSLAQKACDYLIDSSFLSSLQIDKAA